MKCPSLLAAALLVFPCLAQIARSQDISLTLPPDTTRSTSQVAGVSSYALPTGPFRNGQIPTQVLEGTVQQTAWRVTTPVTSTLALLQPLRAELESQGFSIVFQCDTADCGGFDFRFGTTVLPEPEMHVDLGDFRFLSATRGKEAVSLLVSKSATSGFVQTIIVSPTDVAIGTIAAAPDARVEASSERRSPEVTTASGGGIAMLLLENGAAVIDGLDFPTGSADLPDASYPSLDRLADWLKANPALTVAVVGHTDAAGGLDANLALSRKRAETVRQYLVARQGVDARQVEANGVGYLAPIASNLTEDGRQKNRRVEVVLTSTQVQP